jgi:hypothetical protein
MEDTISQAKAEFVRAKERVIRLLAITPEDRINWSPSPTSRTPIQLVAHAALGISFVGAILDGRAPQFSSIAGLDGEFREQEKPFTTREQVLALLEANSTAHLAWLDALTPEKLASTVTTPFGAIPMQAAIGLQSDHIRNHVAQMEYIQTIYGDHDWHVG